MISRGSYIVPSAILAVAVHALVAFALAMNWNSKATISIPKAQRYYIAASLVAHNPYTVKKEEEQRKAASERERRQRLARERQEAEKRARLAAAKREQARREKLAREEAQKEDQARLIARVKKVEAADKARAKAAAERAAQAKKENALSMAVMQEQDARQAVTDDEKAMAYVARIKQTIIQNWSRPPSARNGMQALLKVHLVPDGEVVAVTVAKSSGNSAFDRSAVLAVQKAQSFDVPSDPRLFEKYFRTFEVLFRPEDLRQ